MEVYARHLLHNILPALMIQFTINLPDDLVETSLSFLASGVQRP
jgi:ABC-type dipeptide/oligopeptide/nickel transport system permease subunit